MGYNNIVIPNGKDPAAYTFVERRAEIFNIIIQTGHPRCVNQSDFAKRYGVSRVQIHKDIKTLKSEIKKSVTEDSQLIVHMMFNKVMIKGITSKNFKENVQAAKMAKMWYDWLFDTGQEKREPTEIDLKDNHMTATNWADLYREVEDERKAKDAIENTKDKSVLNITGN